MLEMKKLKNLFQLNYDIILFSPMMIIHLKHPTLRSYHSRKGAPHSQRIPTVGDHKACHKIRIVHKHEFPAIVFQKSPGLHRVMYLLHLYMTKSVC